MFERYTEKARRVIFFARYEASQFGAQAIEAEHNEEVKRRQQMAQPFSASTPSMAQPFTPAPSGNFPANNSTTDPGH